MMDHKLGVGLVGTLLADQLSENTSPCATLITFNGIFGIVKYWRLQKGVFPSDQVRN